MITLYQFPPKFGIANSSPFCLMVETYMRMAGIDYVNKYTGRTDRAPKGKLPFIDDDGCLVADSRLIVTYLKEKYGDTVDGCLTKEQQAIMTAVNTMVTEHLYWVGVYYRWQKPAGWEVLREAFFTPLPWLLRGFISRKVRKHMLDRLHKQGLGVHQEHEIDQMGIEDLIAIRDLLGDKPYMFGEQVSSLDATVYSVTSSLIAPPILSPVKDFVLQQKNLVKHCQRIHMQYYPDFE